MKIALFGSIFDDKTPSSEKQIVAMCKKIAQHNIALHVFDDFLATLSAASKATILRIAQPFHKLPKVDMVFSMGGDGTFLRSASYIGSNNIPILGINIGRLGFLADVNCNDFEAMLLEIIEKRYRVESRMLLQLGGNDTESVFEENPIALNEVAVLKQDTASMLTIHAYINDEYLTSYQSDGLVVATPTGSTAYALSIGGPIMMPTAPNIIIAAIAPHSLNMRPLVVSYDSRITLKFESRSGNFLVSLDGQSKIMRTDSVLEIKRNNYSLKVIKRIGHTFFETLRDKLMWGADIRTKI